MTPRENATQELLYFIDQFAPGSPNKDVYEARLNKMTHKEFEAFIVALETGEEVLALWIANMDEHKIDLERNFAIADQLGHTFFHHLHLTDPETGAVVETPIPHMVVDLPLRRQAQMLYKKMAVPDHNQAVDERSGQPTGDSKGASMSYPELQITAAKGLDNQILELIKFRGGDSRAYNAANRSIMETGGASMDAITARGPTNVKANDTLSVYLKAMGLDINL